MEEAKAKKMDAQRFKFWFEGEGGICRVTRSRLEFVIDISHIELGHFAALTASPSPSGLMIVELAAYFPCEAVAWSAIQDDESPTHAAKPAVQWMKEQYLTDRNARVERLSVS